MKLEKSNTRRGYVALTSILVISFLVMALVFAVSLSGFFLRENILDSYAKAVSVETADACVYLALLKLAQNRSYQGNETIIIDAETCDISQIQADDDELEISVSAGSAGAVTRIFVIVNADDLSLVSWKEVF